MSRQLKIGSLIAYLNVVLHMLTSVFLTPFLIQGLGAGEYGVYKIIQSFAAPLAIMSFGISNLVVRNIVFYQTRNDVKAKENFLFTIRTIAIILALLVCAFGAILFFFIDEMYANTLTPYELNLAKTLFTFLLLNVAFSVILDSYMGIIKAHEKFIINNGISTLRLVFRLLSIFLLINIGVGSLGIVLTDLCITIITLLFCSIFDRFKLHEKPKFHCFDKQMIKVCFTFSAAVFLQAIVNQVNQNVDNIILGIMKGTMVVTIYSTALTLYTCFNSIVTIIGGMYAPRASKLVAENADSEKLTNFVIAPARIQLMIALLCIVGFVLVGQDFIQLWLGTGYEDVYKITLILIIPVVIPLIESITNNILDAMLKRMARSLILVGMCVFNIIVSVILVNTIGYIGAAYGTALSLIFGHGILMNIYLHKKIKLNIFRMFREIFKGTLKCAIITAVVGIFIAMIPNNIYTLVFKIVLISVIYLLLLYLFGMNNNEKNKIKKVLKGRKA